MSGPIQVCQKHFLFWEIYVDSIMSRLGNCDTCGVNIAKYTCPACDHHSCSLTCISSHKKATDCDGLKPRTTFVPLAKFDEAHFKNDVQLLEEVNRLVYRCGRDRTKRFTRIFNELPIQLHRLKGAATRRETNLYFLPQHFTRHQGNTTFLDWRSRKISWRLQLTFLNAEMLTYHEERCSEDVLLQDIISKYLTSAVTTPRVLRGYQKAGLDSIDVLMKAEKAADPVKKFYKLDMKKSLKDNLAKKTVVEYPQLFIVIQNFYTAKNVTQVVDIKKQKMTDYLQLNNNEDQKEPEEQFSSDTSESSSDDDDDEDLDDLFSACIDQKV